MKIVSFFTVILLWQWSYAQSFNNIITYSTQNGLSNNTITCLQKDEAGFLWIGTHEGLNRYDGTTFINILSNSRNKLPSNNIRKIVFLNKNLLAVATDAGLCLLNTATLQGQTIELPLHKKFAGSGYSIEDILYQKKNRELWVATWHGLFILDERGKIQQQMMAKETAMPAGSFAKHLLQDTQGNIYFYSAQEPAFYYPDFRQQVKIPVQSKLPGFAINDYLQKGFTLRSAQMLDTATICIVSKYAPDMSDDYIFYSNLKTGRQFSDKLNVSFDYEKRSSNAFPLNDSVFLVNSYFGEPLFYNSNNHLVRRASDQPLWFTSWPDGFATNILKDGNHTWIATHKGLLQSSQKTSAFKTVAAVTKIINEQEGLVSYNAALYEDNRLWLACMGAGVFSWDSSGNKIYTVFDKKTADTFKKKMVSTRILSAGEAIWLQSVYGPAQVNTPSLRLTAIAGLNKPANFDDLAGYPLKDNRGNIWSTLPDGITQFNIAAKSFTYYKTKYQGGSFPLLRAGPKTFDSKGDIWMARQDTLVKYDAATKTFSTVLLTSNNKPLRPVTAIASDGADILYLAVGGTFAIYHISTHSIAVYTKQTGIVSTSINDLVSDASGNAWLGTEAGLVFYNKQRMKFSSYTKADGLPDDNVIGINFTDDSRRQLFLGFAKTYCLFEPSLFLLEKSVPKNYITGVEVDGTFLRADSFYKLSYRQNSISFSYTGINFNQGQQNNYACMLEGFDQEWKYSGVERKVNYINLPPGTYTFKVKSANHQGEWNEEPAIFSFTISPPFWQRWWFRLLALGLILSAIYYLVQKREAGIKKDNKVKLQVSELRMQALRAQMNPHFIFNSLNSIQNYILSNNTIDAAGYLSKFAKLIRRILDQSKHNFLPLGEVMETLQMYVEMEAFRFNNEFSYHFDVEPDDDLLDAKLPPMLLQPFVENAILHGLMPKAGEKRLYISCKMVAGHAEIIIDDNGIGRTQHQAKAGHESQGEKLTSGMLESMQQMQHTRASISFTDKTENGTATGTTVTIKFSLK